MSTGGNLSNFGGLMVKYSKEYVDWFRKTESFMANLPKERWEGEKGVVKNRVRLNVGVGNQSDGGALPVAGHSEYMESEWTRKFTTASARITDGLLATAASSSHAAKGALDDLMSSTMDMLARYENFMLYRDGTGVVATLGAAFAGSALAQVSDGRLAGLRGARLEVRDASTPTTIHDNFTTASMSRALSSSLAQIVTEETMVNASEAATDLIVWGQGAHSSYGKAITGLDKGIDDSTAAFQGVTVTSYPEYTSPVLDNSGTDRNLSTRLVRQMLSMLAQEHGKGSIDGLIAFMSNYQAVNWEELFMAEQRTTPSTRIGGVKVPTFQSIFGNVSIRTDADMHHDKIFFVDRSAIKMPIQKELDWRRTGSSIFVPDPNNTLSHIANMVGIYDLFYPQRNVHGRIEDLSATVLGAY